ncbi:inositol monophosphatase family protein [Rhodohalobacter sp. 614A]|uniref:inositol monophosphatase family protein n=1 Tax=Rhodohalobacter sp. 614A TaxID=2908649 RepID=UPI001F39BFDC|nr:inositol monophosphatase family protein [Rhodohalobacter sp. 614A]
MISDLDVAKQAAREGVRVIKSFREKGIKIKKKGFHDLVTDADVETEKAIIKVIKKHFPDDEILAEESSAEDAMSDSRVWIIDPIDGTTNFANGFPIYCVSVALWENKEPKVGIVIEVNREEEFTAIAGEGAWLNDEEIHVSSTAEYEHAFIGTGFPYNDLSVVDSYLKLFRKLMEDVQGIRRPGSAAYDLCCVASGRFDGFYEYSLHIWDVAAAALIIKEAGGTVTDWDGSDKWAFGERFVAGNSEVHFYLLHKIQEFIPAEQRKVVTESLDHKNSAS